MATNPSDEPTAPGPRTGRAALRAVARLPRRGLQIEAARADPESLSAQAERLLYYEAESPIEATLLGREPRVTLLPSVTRTSTARKDDL